MGKIVAIGGGSVSRTHEKTHIHKINKEIVKLSGKDNPKLLFIPTASSDSLDYTKHIKMQFERRLGCNVDALYLIDETYTNKEIKEKIFSADIIYVGGGNTLRMMTVWRRHGVDKLLKEAYKKDIVMCGVSAGSICWFSSGNSDSRKFTSNTNQLIKVTGLGLIEALHCPHYDVEKHRQKSLRQMMKKIPRIVSIALDNCVALEVVDGKFRILKNKKDANAYKIYWKDKKYHKEIIESKKQFEDLGQILSK